MRHWMVFCFVSCVSGLFNAENRTTTLSDSEYCQEINCLGKEQLCLNRKCYCAKGYIPDDFLHSCIKCSVCLAEEDGVDIGAAATELCLRRSTPLRIMRMLFDFMVPPLDLTNADATGLEDVNVLARQDDVVPDYNNIVEPDDINDDHSLPVQYKLICEGDVMRQYNCPRCGRKYKWKWMFRHEDVELAHNCPYCMYRSSFGVRSQLETPQL